MAPPQYCPDRRSRRQSCDAATIDAHIRAVEAAAGKLTPEQVGRLRALLPPPANTVKRTSDMYLVVAAFCNRSRGWAGMVHSGPPQPGKPGAYRRGRGVRRSPGGNSADHQGASVTPRSGHEWLCQVRGHISRVLAENLIRAGKAACRYSWRMPLRWSCLWT